jgi:3-dehydroquinate synthase
MVIDVKLDGKRDYPVYIDETLNFEKTLLKLTPSSSYVCITNNTIAAIYSSKIEQWKNSLPNFHVVTVDDGEKFKNMDSILDILDFMLEKKLDRNTVVIAFGGGVVGDMAGFASSLFLRGVQFVQVPTTLLSMVDSSVGGKTGVNHKMGKNLIGAFYQPQFVWIDTKYLQTLPEREFRAGCGEVCKYGFIGGIECFRFIESEFKNLLNMNQKTIQEAIELSINIKAKVVSEDEKEMGSRALLNFGHTFGHSLEKFYGFGEVLHGEAVLWGIKCAVEVGIKAGYIDNDEIFEYKKILDSLDYPKLPFTPDISKLHEFMFSDKKVESGIIKFVIPTNLGNSIITPEIDENIIKSVMNEVFSA